MRRKRERLCDMRAYVDKGVMRYYAYGLGRVVCGSCGSVEFRVVLGDVVRLYCARCNMEHVVEFPPWLRRLVEQGEAEVEVE